MSIFIFIYCDEVCQNEVVLLAKYKNPALLNVISFSNTFITRFPGQSSSNNWSAWPHKEVVPLPVLGEILKDHPSFRLSHGDG